MASHYIHSSRYWWTQAIASTSKVHHPKEAEGETRTTSIVRTRDDAIPSTSKGYGSRNIVDLLNQQRKTSKATKSNATESNATESNTTDDKLQEDHTKEVGDEILTTPACSKNKYRTGKLQWKH